METGTVLGNALSRRCHERGLDAILAEWDSAKNAPLTPGDVSAGSHRKVWWRCRAGHSWQAQVRSRVNGAGCPMCANRRLQRGKNDLASVFPTLAAEWDRMKNGDARPEDELTGSERYAWWRCAQGHSWRATIVSRTRGSGCPICTGRTALKGTNDLSTLFPQIAAQWDSQRNGRLAPEDVTPFSNKRVWWRCDLGHTWQAVIAARTSNQSDCPYCTGKLVLAGFNDLATQEPEIAAQWEPTLNGQLEPTMVTPGSRKRVWWICQDGHVWKTAVYSRTGPERCGCPVCAGKAKRGKRYTLPEAAESIRAKE